MKKKRKFYDDKKRNQKWTEEKVGREIDFADKYDENGNYSDKYDAKRLNKKELAKKKAKRKKILKAISVIALCLVLVCVGYTTMDVHMIRQATAVEQIGKIESQVTGTMSEVNINFSSYKVESISLDSSVMLSSVINDAVDNGFTSITFDAKRSDGTIGYNSALASVDTFGAISTPASQIESSVKEMLANDILPIARVCCYQDNVVPAIATDSAVMQNGEVYTDDKGNTYLNPDSETAYNYIKDIIQECYGYGITVFTLYGCDLPEDISSDYNDGFDAIAQKLNDDLGGTVKLLEEVDVEILGKDSETGKTTNTAIKNDIKAFDKIENNQVYYISTKLDESKVLSQLNKYDVTRSIIEN
jgi:hypothetical protein